MSIGEEKQWKDLQELRKMYSLKDTRTPSGSLTAHGLRLERDLEGYRKDIQELNRMFALEGPRRESRVLKTQHDGDQKGANDSADYTRDAAPSLPAAVNSRVRSAETARTRRAGRPRNEKR
jgi:hypothetical protein